VTRVADLSVTIATLDRPESLMRCLNSLLSGAVLPGEVIVVDQSRSDATQTMVEQRERSAVPIIYIRQHARGLSVSRNLALTQVSHPIVAVIDDDCVPDTQWVAAIERAFSSSVVPDAVTGRVFPLGPEIHGTYVVAARESPLLRDFSGKALPWLIGSGNNFAVKRHLLANIGGCDERLGVGSPGKAAEDIDLFYRLLRAGARIRYEPKAIVYHQRQSKIQRMASRWSYGYGTGAFCTIWLRSGDLYALRILGHWLCWQARDFVVAAGHRQWLEAYQKWLSLKGTAGGMVYGLRVRHTR
jgi:O-antigen biosynthesis protein